MRRKWKEAHDFKLTDSSSSLWSSVTSSCQVPHPSPYLHWLAAVAQSCLTLCDPPWIAALQASLSIINSQSLLKPMSTESVMPSSHLILCRPLLLLPSIFPSNRVFSNESVLHIWWPKYWSFGFSMSPSNEYSGLISFRMDWLDLPAVPGTLQSLLQTTVQKHQFFGAASASERVCLLRAQFQECPQGGAVTLTRSRDCALVDESRRCVLSCPVVSDSLPPMSSLRSSSVYGIFPATVLEWVAISFSRGYS